MAIKEEGEMERGHQEQGIVPKDTPSVIYFL
jgi:hypothetical protein